MEYHMQHGPDSSIRELCRFVCCSQASLPSIATVESHHLEFIQELHMGLGSKLYIMYQVSFPIVL